MLQLDDAKAKTLFKVASPEFKEILLDSYGEKFFKERKPFNQILTLDDVFEATGENPNDPKYLTGAPDTIGYELSKLLPKALNPIDWVLNWEDPSQRKWGPWFYFNHPGFRFRVSFYSYTYSGSTGGSRHRFASEAISDHAGKQFLPIWKQWLA